jgi:hypothetical protein
LIIVDINSQGTEPVDSTIFKLVKQWPHPPSLFVFSDLSFFSACLAPQPAAAQTPTERMLWCVGPRRSAAEPESMQCPIFYKARGTKKGLPMAGSNSVFFPSDTWEPARDMSPLIDHVLLKDGVAHEQSYVGASADCEDLQKNLSLWVGRVASKLHNYSGALLVIFSHGGFGAMNSKTANAGGRAHRLGEEGISGIPSAHKWDSENLSATWVASKVILPLAAAAAGGCLTALQFSCYAPEVVGKMAGTIQTALGVAPLAEFSDSAENERRQRQRLKLEGSPPAVPRVVLVSQYPLRSPMQDLVACFGNFGASAISRSPKLSLVLSPPPFF